MVLRIQPEYSGAALSIVQPMVERGLKRSIGLTLESIAYNLRRDLMQMWLAFGSGVEAVALTEISEEPTGKVCIISLLSGNNRARWFGHLEEIEKFARNENCKAMRIYGRKGWTRLLPSWRVPQVILERTL